MRFPPSSPNIRHEVVPFCIYSAGSHREVNPFLVSTLPVRTTDQVTRCPTKNHSPDVMRRSVSLWPEDDRGDGETGHKGRCEKA